VKGYHNTSISDIMAATGRTKGGLYAHFDGKEALRSAAYERAVEVWRGIVFKGVRKASDPQRSPRLRCRSGDPGFGRGVSS